MGQHMLWEHQKCQGIGIRWGRWPSGGIIKCIWRSCPSSCVQTAGLPVFRPVRCCQWIMFSSRILDFQQYLFLRGDSQVSGGRMTEVTACASCPSIGSSFRGWSEERSQAASPSVPLPVRGFQLQPGWGALEAKVWWHQARPDRSSELALLWGKQLLPIPSRQSEVEGVWSLPPPDVHTASWLVPYSPSELVK